jgi:hypothetical protein
MPMTLFLLAHQLLSRQIASTEVALMQLQSQREDPAQGSALPGSQAMHQTSWLPAGPLRTRLLDAVRSDLLSQIHLDTIEQKF